jgi:hypothetical protein
VKYPVECLANALFEIKFDEIIAAFKIHNKKYAAGRKTLIEMIQIWVLALW